MECNAVVVVVVFCTGRVMGMGIVKCMDWFCSGSC